MEKGGARETMITLDGVARVFGAPPKKAREILETFAEHSQQEIKEKTGAVVAVRDASFSVARETVFVIMGLSGSGKSTLLRCINRLVEPTAGSVELDTMQGALDMTELPPAKLRTIRRRHISMVFQEFALFPHLTALKNVMFGLSIQRVPRPDRVEKAKEALRLVGLADWAEAMPSQLSGGMRQRVGLARALAAETEVLLMDEPFSALDPLIRLQMQDELLKLQSDVRKSIVFVTHDLDEALRLGDTVTLMEQGRIVQMGEPQEIILQPKTEYVSRFVRRADTGCVLTVSTVARTLGSEASELSLIGDGGGVQVTDERTGDIFCLNEAGQVTQCAIDGRSLPAVPCGADHGGACVYVVRGDALLVDVMGIFVSQTDRLPIVVADEDGKFRGVVSERDLLRGLLTNKA